MIQIYIALRDISKLYLCNFEYCTQISFWFIVIFVSKDFFLAVSLHREQNLVNFEPIKFFWSSFPREVVFINYSINEYSWKGY